MAGNVASLLELEKALSAPDAIMERSATDTLRAYLAAGGNPGTAVELLSDHYRGYAQQTSLVCSWLAATAPAGSAPLDEAYFLEEAVRARFDERACDDASERVYAETRKSPAWFLALMSTPRGRVLLYSLAQAHPNSTTLALAVEKAWQDGRVDEVAALGPAVAGKFDIFHGVLRSRLDAILVGAAAAPGDTAAAASAAAAVSQLRELCVASPAAYVLAQLLCAELGDAPGGAPLRRVAQEIEGAAVSARGPALLRTFAPLLARTEPDAAAAVAACELATASDRLFGGAAGGAGGASAAAAVSEAVARLWALYHAAEMEAATSPQEQGGGGVHASGALSPAPLRSPQVLDALLRAAFVLPIMAAQAAQRTQHHGAPGGGSQAAQPASRAPAAAASAPFPPAFELLAVACASPDERPGTRAALRRAAEACGLATRGAPPGAEANFLRSALRDCPVAAAGVVMAMRAVLLAGTPHGGFGTSNGGGGGGGGGGAARGAGGGGGAGRHSAEQHMHHHRPAAGGHGGGGGSGGGGGGGSGGGGGGGSSLGVPHAAAAASPLSPLPEPAEAAHVALAVVAIEQCPACRPSAVDALSACLRPLGRAEPAARTDLRLRLAPPLFAFGHALDVIALLTHWAHNADLSSVRSATLRLLDLASPPYSREFTSASLRLCAAGGMRRGSGGAAAAFGDAVEAVRRRCVPPLDADEAAALEALTRG